MIARERGLGGLVEAILADRAADPEALAAFAQDHPESDFALEAGRSAEVFASRSVQPIRSAGLVVTVPSDSAEGRRVVQAFVERASKTYSIAGIRLVPLKRKAPSARCGTRLPLRRSARTVMWAAPRRMRA